MSVVVPPTVQSARCLKQALAIGNITRLVPGVTMFISGPLAHIVGLRIHAS